MTSKSSGQKYKYILHYWTMKEADIGSIRVNHNRHMETLSCSSGGIHSRFQTLLDLILKCEANNITLPQSRAPLPVQTDSVEDIALSARNVQDMYSQTCRNEYFSFPRQTWRNLSSKRTPWRTCNSKSPSSGGNCTTPNLQATLKRTVSAKARTLNQTSFIKIIC